jgi:MFS family permease
VNSTSDRRSFWALIVTQFLAAFNDNVFQIVAALLIIRWLEESAAKSLVAASGIIFSAPFLLFSLVAGRLADRFSKSRILVLTKMLDLGIVSLSIAGMYMASPALLLTGLFLLGTFYLTIQCSVHIPIVNLFMF